MKTNRILFPLLAFVSLACFDARAALFVTKASQGAGANWTAAIWSNAPSGTGVAPTAGNTYELIDNGVAWGNNTANSRVRNPATDGLQTFPGSSLTLNANTDIRFKRGASTAPVSLTISHFPGVGGAPGLILNGGILNPGDDTVFIATGRIHVASQSILSSGDNGGGAQKDLRAMYLRGTLTGPGNLVVLQSGTTAHLVDADGSGYTGTWIIQNGFVQLAGNNSLGSGSVTLSPTNADPATAVTNLAKFEPMYDIVTPGTLTVNSNGAADAIVVLHQNVRFAKVIVDGSPIPNGTYPYAVAAGAFPTHIAPGGSGSISVGPATPTGLAAQPGDTVALLTWNGNADATGYVVKVSTTLGGPYTPVATNGTGTNFVATGLVNGTTYYYVVSELNDGGESANSNEASVTPAIIAPLITADPVGATNCTGANVTFSVTATGGFPLAYQWYTNAPGPVPIALANQTNSTLTLNNIQVANAGEYTVTVTNTGGSVTSAVAILAIKQATIASVPNSSTNCPGTPASFSTTATGSGTLSYTWRKGAAIVQGPDGNSSFSIGAVAAGDAGPYSVTVIGDCNTISNNFLLVVAAPPVITAQPTSRAVPMRNGTVFSVTAISTNATFVPVTYQWQTNNVDVTGATGTSLAISNLTLAANGMQVRVNVTDCAGTTPSLAATLTVTPVSGISFDFNTPGQYTNAPYNLVDNDWQNNQLVNSQPFGPVVPFEKSTGGVVTATSGGIGSGALDLMFNNNTDQSSQFTPLSYDFSLPGTVLQASLMTKIKVPVVVQRAIQIGFITATNGDQTIGANARTTTAIGINSTAGLAFMSAIFQSTVINVVNPSYMLRAQYKPAAGTTATEIQPINNPTNVLDTNRWYKLVAIFSNTTAVAANTMSISATVQDMGRDGITPGAVTLAMGPQTITLSDLVTSNRWYLAIRGFEQGGNDYWDNIFVTTQPGALQLIAPVADQTVNQGQRARFLALVDGDGPYTYQWFKNGVAIPNAGNWKYVTPPLAPADSGAQFSVTVSNALGGISSTGTVTVTAQDLAVVSVGSVDGSVIGLRFSQPVDSVTAQAAANYTINGTPAVTARLVANGGIQQWRTNEVLLTPASLISGSFTVAVANVQSFAGALIGSQNTATGAVIGLTGIDIDPQSIGHYIQTPTLPGSEYSFAPGQITVNAGGHDIFGTFDGFRFTYKQVTGDFDIKVRVAYQDAVRTPNKAGFDARISLDPASPHFGAYANPALPGRNFIEGGFRTNYNRESGAWGNQPGLYYPNAWLRFRRVANTFIRYSSTNGVNWQCDGQIQSTVSGVNFPDTMYVGLANNCNVGPNTAQQNKLSQMDNYGNFAGYVGSTIAITAQPAGSTVAAGAAATLTTTATLTGGGAPASAGELTYTLQRTNTAAGGWTNMPLAGATNAAISTGILRATDNGAQFRVIVSAPGASSVTSSVVTVTVTDTAGPTVAASFAAPLGPNQLVLSFSEFLNAATALNPANYLVTNGLGVQVIVTRVWFVNNDPSRVVLTFADALPGGTNFVRITGVTDLGGNAIASTLLAIVQTSAAVSGLTPYQAQGPVVMEWWDGLISQGGTRDLVNDVRYRRNQSNTEVWSGPNGSFDFITYSNVFGIHPTAFPSSGWGENYGVKMYAYFRPPTTAAYKFHMRADDFAELWVNTNLINSTLPADVVIGTTTNSPVNQQAWMAMDGVDTNANIRWGSKYLNFDAAGVNTGFYVTPAVGNTLINGIEFWAGGDAPERDPMTFSLSGSPNTGTNGPWTVIVTDNTGLANTGGASGTGRYLSSSNMFANATSYRSYRVLFPTIRGPAQNSMQIGEVRLLDANGVKVVPSGATLLSQMDVNNATYNITNSSSNLVFSAGTMLNAGQLYYIETRFHEGGGGDGVAVAFRTDGAIPAQTEVISNNFLVFPSDRAPLTPVQWEQYSGLATLNPLAGQGGWTGASGNGSILDLITSTNLSNFVARVPNISGYAQYFGWNSNRFQSGATMDNYMARIYAYFVPPTNGNYRFWVQVDDTAQFLMNTNAANSTDPAGSRVLGQIINYGGTTAVNSNGIINIGGNSGAYTTIATNVNLIGGQRYYMEARWREGGGGDGINVAVRAQGDTATPGLAESIPLSMLEYATNANVQRYGPIGLQGILSTTNGVNAGVNPTVREGDILNFQAVGLYGAGSMQGSLANANISATSGQSETNNIASMGFIWLKNGIDLAKNQVFGGQMYYVSQPVTFADNGATISLLVSNTFSTATQTVTLTVIQDTTPPTIEFANGSQYGDTVTLLFSEPVDSQTSQLLSSYSIPGLQIFWVKRDDVNRRRVVLGTSRHTPLQVYTVTATGIRDVSQAGNTAGPLTKSFTGWGTGGIGGVYVEIFTNMNGSIDDFLQTSPKYIYNMPDITYYTNNFGFGSTGFAADTGLNFFAARISGLFMPPSNGLYRFFVRADDNSQLFMNTNGPDPRGVTMIARNDGANSVALNGLSGYQTGLGVGGDGTLRGSSISPIISLTNGTPYWLEALFKEGTGGDYLEVVMRAIDATTLTEIGGVPAAGAGNVLGGGFFSAPGNPDLIQIIATPMPAELFLTENQQVDIKLNVTAVIPASMLPFVQYQWARSNANSGVFTNIPGATTFSLSPFVPYFAPRADDGAAYQITASLPGATVRYQTLLHVSCDTTPPAIVSSSSLDGKSIGIRFSEPVDLGIGGETSTYEVKDLANNNTIIVTAAIVRTNVDPRTVSLTLLESLTGNSFEVTALDMADRATVGCGGPNFATLITVGNVQGLTPLDVGGPLAVGSSFSSTNGEISVVAGGADIWGTADQGHVTIGQRSGDFDIWTRVQSLVPRSASPDIAKAGLVVRDGTNADAKTLTVLMNPPVSLGGRDLLEAGARTNIVPGLTAPTGPWPFGANVTPAGIPNAWVRLKREGFIWRAFYSTNGVDWLGFATNFVDFPRTVWLGLGTTAHNNGSAPTVAEYRNIHIPNPPTITVQPSGPATVAFHGSTSFTVTATNPANSGPLTYTWRRAPRFIADVEGGDVDTVVVGTGPTLTIPDARGVHSGEYQVEVGNDGGSVLSATISLTVLNGLPTIGSDTINATQNVARVVSAASLIGNDSDPEGSNLLFRTISGVLPVTVGTNFSEGNLAGSTLFGSAAVSTNGYLVLHNPQISLAGSLILDDLTPGKRASGFRASFKLRLSEATLEPADGFSFNFAPDLPIGATGPRAAEDGMGNGFSFAVDNYRFAPYPGGTSPNTSGMKIRFGGVDVAGVQMPTWNRPAFVPVTINLVNSALNVTVDGTNVFGTVVLPSVSSTGRFGIYARSGGQYQAAIIDDLNITVYTADTTNGGTVAYSGGNVTYSNGVPCGSSDTFYYVVGDGEVGGNVTAPVAVNLPCPVVEPVFIPGSASYSTNGGIATFSASFQTTIGVSYTVEYTDTLNGTPPPWTLLTTIAGDGTIKSFTDPGPLPPFRFYRIRTP